MTALPAIAGGRPQRNRFLHYARHSVDEDDIRNVEKVLRSAWLTTGPELEGFEENLSSFLGSDFVVAMSSGTAALHATMAMLNLNPGDEVLMPAITFVATANCVLYCGATPVFVDVNPDSLLIDMEDVKNKITENTKAVIAMDYAGQPTNYQILQNICCKNNIRFIVDCCHSLGAKYKDKPVGQYADFSIFSFHPAKSIACGEGGAVATNSLEYAEALRMFRNHGIDSDFVTRRKHGVTKYDMTELGYNYRLSEIHSALGNSQLKRLPEFLERRQKIATYYDCLLEKTVGVQVLVCNEDVVHANHLYVIKLDLSLINVSRDEILSALHAEGIGVNVHYAPVYTHSYYKNISLDSECKVTDSVYQQILSLPIYPGMTDADVKDVVAALDKVITYFRR